MLNDLARSCTNCFGSAALAEQTGIDDLRRTTAHEPDYDVLMRHRLQIMDEHGLGMMELNEAIGTLEPFPGAAEFVEWVRERYQVRPCVL